MQILIKASVVDFIFSKIPCFQQIPLNAFRRIRLNYENYSFRRIYFRHSSNIQTPKASLKNSLMETHLK